MPDRAALAPRFPEKACQRKTWLRDEKGAGPKTARGGPGALSDLRNRVRTVSHEVRFSGSERTPPSHLRRCRLLVGLRQANLAERAGVSRDTIGRLEAGRNRPQLATAIAIGRALREDD